MSHFAMKRPIIMFALALCAPIRQALYVIAFSTLSQAWAVAAQPLKAVASAPDDKLIEAFTGKARTL